MLLCLEDIFFKKIALSLGTSYGDKCVIMSFYQEKYLGAGKTGLCTAVLAAGG